MGICRITSRGDTRRSSAYCVAEYPILKLEAKSRRAASSVHNRHPVSRAEASRWRSIQVRPLPKSRCCSTSPRTSSCSAGTAEGNRRRSARILNLARRLPQAISPNTKAWISTRRSINSCCKCGSLCRKCWIQIDVSARIIWIVCDGAVPLRNRVACHREQQACAQRGGLSAPPARRV